jgi:pimeloyl-ACP methyl ester carboxylesterase
VVLGKSLHLQITLLVLLLSTNFLQCVGFVDFLTFCRLQSVGFRFHRTALTRFFTLFPLRPVALFSRQRSPVRHLTYWHRSHTSRTKLPIVFIHGIGIGLYPYVDFLKELNSTSGIEGDGVDDQVGIIAVEIMPVSFRITHQALDKEEICDEIQAIVKHHGFEKYVLVAHSYGTAVATYMLKSERTSNQVGHVVLIDPITILLHLPDVAYNFTRRKPVTANEHQLYYFASMDMGISHTLARQFFWSDVILWKKDLEHRRVTFSLAQRDLIVNTEAVGQYLASSDCDATDYKHDIGELVGYAGSNGNGNAKSIGNGRVGSDGNVHVKSCGNGCGEHNGEALHDAKANGNYFLATNGQIGNGQATKPKSHAKINAQATDLMPVPICWKSRPWRGQGLETLWQHGIDHAQVFDSAKRRKGLLSAIRAYCAQPAD